jgi:hypothetical protein
LQSHRFTSGVWSTVPTNIAGDESVGWFALDGRSEIVHVAWTSLDATSNQAVVRTARTDVSSGQWMAPTVVFTSSTTQPVLPRLRLLTDGRSAVTWGYQQGDRSPWIALGASASTWRPAQRLDDDLVYSSNAPDVVAVANGWASAWYRYQDNGKLDVLLRRLR